MITEVIPKNATIRQEYVKCGNYDCDKKHGPYYYAYWKEKNKLKKKYIGKDYVDGLTRVLMHQNGLLDSDLTWTQFKKAKFIREQSEKGNTLAHEYEIKCEAGKVSIDWAYKKLKEGIFSQRHFKMAKIADKKGFQYESADELYNMIYLDMKANGFDADNEDDIDSYLNLKFM